MGVTGIIPKEGALDNAAERPYNQNYFIRRGRWVDRFVFAEVRAGV